MMNPMLTLARKKGRLLNETLSIKADLESEV